MFNGLDPLSRSRSRSLEGRHAFVLNIQPVEHLLAEGQIGRILLGEEGQRGSTGDSRRDIILSISPSA